MRAGTGDLTFETSDGSAIAFTRHRAPGAGAPRLALIHSLALDRSVWDGVVNRLSEEAELLTYDCRGHGRSERRATAFTAELFARDLAELLDHVGWPSAAIGGCSMGGCVAMALAGLYPARVRGLGLIDTTAWYGEQGAAQWRARAADARAKGLPALVGLPGPALVRRRLSPRPPGTGGARGGRLCRQRSRLLRGELRPSGRPPTCGLTFTPFGCPSRSSLATRTTPPRLKCRASCTRPFQTRR